MNIQLIRECNSAILSDVQCFRTLKHLVPVFDNEDFLIFIKGESSVIYKMEDKETGDYFAVKIYLDGKDRAERYSIITDNLHNLDSPYFLPIHYFKDEFFINNNTSNSLYDSDKVLYPVLLMEWVEGVSLERFLYEMVDNTYMLEKIAYEFSRFTIWITLQPFVHGNIKANNIFVRYDGSPVLLDYDNFYSSAMTIIEKCSNKESIDDSPLIAILLSLKVLSICPGLISQIRGNDYLLFSEKNFSNIPHTQLFKILFPSFSGELNKLLGTMLIMNSGVSLSNLPVQALQLKKPLCEMVDNYEIEVDEYIDLKDARIDRINGEKIFYSSDETRLLMFGGHRLEEYEVKKGTKVVCNMAFSRNLYGNSIKRIFLPSSVICIGDKAFDRCINLREIRLSDNIRKIGKYAFCGCSKLESVILPSQLIRIEKYTFSRCEELKSIIIPEGVTSIEEGAFEYCWGLKKIVLPNTLIYIDEKAFDCTSIKEIIIPTGSLKKYELLLPDLKDKLVESN